MITEAIIIALITVAGNIAVSFFAYHKGLALINYRLEQLEAKVNKHNNLIERMYEAEKKIAILEDDLKSIK